MHAELIDFIRHQFSAEGFIPLHEPILGEAEKRAVCSAIDSGFVSSVGPDVDQFARQLEEYLGAEHVVPLVNGTAALQLALHLNNVGYNDLVICPALTFAATCNAVRYQGAEPVLLDVSPVSYGLDPEKLAEYLNASCQLNAAGKCIDSESGKTIKACIAVHTLGFPCQIKAINKICQQWGIALIEDAAQALGSQSNQSLVGADSKFACFSFNGNKILTTGGGGALVTNSKEIAELATHLSTTARVRGMDVDHDMLGFNFRMPNLNAALGLGQLLSLPGWIKKKKILALNYQRKAEHLQLEFLNCKNESDANYWLNTVLCENETEKLHLLNALSEAQIGARPLWKPMHLLPMYSKSSRGDLTCSEDLYSRAVCLPSSPNFRGSEEL